MPLLNIFVCLKCCFLPEMGNGACKASLSLCFHGLFCFVACRSDSRRGGVATSAQPTCDPLDCSDCLENALGGPFLSLPKTTKLLTEDA